MWNSIVYHRPGENVIENVLQFVTSQRYHNAASLVCKSWKLLFRRALLNHRSTPASQIGGSWGQASIRRFRAYALQLGGPLDPVALHLCRRLPLFLHAASNEVLFWTEIFLIGICKREGWGYWNYSNLLHHEPPFFMAYFFIFSQIIFVQLAI